VLEPSSTAPEEPCPVLSLDWKRLPELFGLCVQMFGGPFYNRSGKTRSTIEKHIAFFCRCLRQKYPFPCTEERQALCMSLLEDAARRTLARPSCRYPLPYYVACVRRLINDDDVDEVMKRLEPPSKLDLSSIFRTIDDV
jgi:hypothetical protein